MSFSGRRGETAGLGRYSSLLSERVSDFVVYVGPRLAQELGIRWDVRAPDAVESLSHAGYWYSSS